MKKLIILLLALTIFVQTATAEDNETLTITINSPEARIYENTDVLLNVTTNKHSDINYEINNESFIGCSNCTEFAENLNLTEGIFFLTITAISGNETINETIDFSVEFPEEFVLTVYEPESKTYNATTVPIDIETSLIADNISYILNSQNETRLCSGCSSITGELTNLEKGSHILEIIATKDNQSIVETVIFDIELEEPEPEPEVNAPQNIEIEIEIKGRVSSEQLNLVQSLINSIIDNIRNLKIEIKSKGHKIKTEVRGYLADEELETLNDLVESLENNEKVKIEIKTKIKKPKFDKGFNKLPKQFKDGEISEEELIELLKKNKFPPGVIKRLVKEYPSEDVINIIIADQYLSIGLVEKLYVIFNQGHNEVIEEIVDNYDLTDEQWSKLILRHDLPPGTIRHIINSGQLNSGVNDVVIDTLEADDDDDDELEELIEKQKIEDKKEEKLLKKLSKDKKEKKKSKELKGKGLKLGTQNGKRKIKVDIEKLL